MTETQPMPQAWNPSGTPAFQTPDESSETGQLSASPEHANRQSPEPHSPHRQDAESPTLTHPSRPPIAQRPGHRARTRTNSSKILHRFTSRGSIGSNAQLADQAGSPASETTSLDLNGRIDREALSKAKGKYKSGVNLDMGLMLNFADEDAFMQSTRAFQEEQDAASSQDAATRKDMLASGGTAAAKAYYQGQGLGYGYSIFPEQQIAAAEASKHAALLAQHQEALRRQGGSRPPPVANNAQYLSANAHAHRNTSKQRASSSSPSAFSSNSSSLSPVPTRASLASALEATNVGATSQNSSTSNMDVDGQGKAKHADPTFANGATLKATTSPDNLNKSSSEGSAPVRDQLDKSPAASIKSRRKTFFGLSSKSTDKVDKIGKVGKKSRRASAVSVNTEGLETDIDGNLRRRRYPNTREMDVLAAQLASEANFERQLQTYPRSDGQWSSTPSGSRTPADRRGAATTPSSPIASPSSQSLAQLSSGFQPLAAPVPRDSPASSGPSSPHLGSVELSVMKHASRAGLNKSPSASPSVTQKANVSGLPYDMLTGLGHGPYPFVPQDVSMGSPDVGGGSVSGDATPHSNRRGSQGAAGTGAAANGSRKTSVLSMTMHDPEAEMQGLTKLPKSGKGTPWGTPWGSRAPSRSASRAPSRAVSPRTSNANLKEAAKQQAQPAAQQSQRSSGTNANLSILNGVNGRRRSQASDENGASLNPPLSNAAIVPTPVTENPSSVFGTPAVETSTAPLAAPVVGDADAVSPSQVADRLAETIARSQSPASTQGQGEHRQRRLTPGGTQGSEGKPKARLSFFGAFGKSREDVSTAKASKVARKENQKRHSLPPSPTQPRQMNLPASSSVGPGEQLSLGLARTSSPHRPVKSPQRQVGASSDAKPGHIQSARSDKVHGEVGSEQQSSSSKRPGFKRFLSRFSSGSPKKTSQDLPPPPAPATAARDTAGPNSPAEPRLPHTAVANGIAGGVEGSDTSGSSRDSQRDQSSSSISTQATDPGADTGGQLVLTPEDLDKQLGPKNRQRVQGSEHRSASASNRNGMVFS